MNALLLIGIYVLVTAIFTLSGIGMGTFHKHFKYSKK